MKKLLLIALLIVVDLPVNSVGVKISDAGQYLFNYRYCNFTM